MKYFKCMIGTKNLKPKEMNILRELYPKYENIMVL